MIASVLDDWAAIAGIVAAVLTIVGLGFIVVQLRQTVASTRLAATIQFQQSFRSSQDARRRLQTSFPVHKDVLMALVKNEKEYCKFATWDELEDLTKDQYADAKAVVNALNDVAQYVADGMPLRSALQQYHTIFIRAGALLYPYIDLQNQGKDSSKELGSGASGDQVTPARWGVRVIELLNAGLAYHRQHPKHIGHEVVLERDAVDGSGRARLVLIRGDLGLIEHYPPYLQAYKSRRWIPWSTWRRAVRRAEHTIRR